MCTHLVNLSFSLLEMLKHTDYWVPPQGMPTAPQLLT